MTKWRHIREQYFGIVRLGVTPPLRTGLSSILAPNKIFRQAPLPQPAAPSTYRVCSVPPVSARCSLVKSFCSPLSFSVSFSSFFLLLPFSLSLHSPLWVDPLSWGGKKDITYEMSRVGCSLLCLTCRVRNFVNKCIKAKLCASC